MRPIALRIAAGLAGLVALGVFVQVYLIASYIFGEADALDAHQGVGFMVHNIEIVAFLAALAGWWGRWRLVGLAFLLPLIGTIQVLFNEGEGWVGGFHGLLALVVLILAAVIGRRALESSRHAAHTRAV
jgi:hypothetical protein